MSDLEDRCRSTRSAHLRRTASRCWPRSATTIRRSSRRPRRDSCASSWPRPATPCAWLPSPASGRSHECLAHLVDGELIISARYRWILAEDEPDIVGYDQALWVAQLGQARGGPGDAAGGLRRASRLEPRAVGADAGRGTRSRFGVHRERGPESVELTFRLAAGHDRIHLAQARRALDAARERAGAS